MDDRNVKVWAFEAIIKILSFVEAKEDFDLEKLIGEADLLTQWVTENDG